MTVVILGAGPAGMSCANALLSFGLEPVVIERGSHVGGIQRANFHPSLWMLGMPGETGSQLTERLARHYFELPIATRLNTHLLAVHKADDRFGLTLEGPEGRFELLAGALVLATGSGPRSTPELEALAGKSERVVIGPLSERIRDDIRGARVLILGGGDNALGHALFLAELGNRVTVRARERFSARNQFRTACAAHPEIELLAGGPAPVLDADQGGIEAVWPDRKERYDWLLAMYGYRPNSEAVLCFDEAIRPALTPTGHIQVDRRQQTSVAGVYAVGDVTDCVQPSVPTAIAQGLAAAKAVEQDLGSHPA